MTKDFDHWNEQKKIIHANADSKLYHEREIWWCSLGMNIGSEQDGTGEGCQRPVLILKGMSRSTCYVVPLTTSLEKHRLRTPLGLVDNKSASALMSQVRLIDTRRLVDKIGFLEKEMFKVVKKAAKSMF